MSQRIVVSIGIDGTISATVAGNQGPRCTDALETIHNLFPGAQVVSSRLTPEYFQSALAADVESQRVQEGNQA